ncbi:hypothetical protein [Actinoplanes rectilineatus]|uniref:hypothetical protein n=1 Tax=Actinoplanes rectilineatus TaxID=113571 RepID=UPI000B2C909D|nr:hypothetical protein [Actinoplanes rectilineatus]
MAHLYADVLLVVHHDDTRTAYEQVSYCPWRGGVTVYQDGEEIIHDDVLDVRVINMAAV